MLLPLIGRVDDGIRVLLSIRPQMVAEFGTDSLHVRTLDRRITQLSGPPRPANTTRPGRWPKKSAILLDGRN
jgi:hypothetical protein